MSSTDSLEEFFGDTSQPIIFSSRPEAIPGDLRIAWRISALCLILNKFWACKARIEHLHIIWWALHTEENRALLLRWLADERQPDEAIVRFDPSLSTTVDLAMGQQLIERQSSGAIALTASGKFLAKKISRTEGVMSAEKDFLGSIPGKLTQQIVKEVPEWR